MKMNNGNQKTVHGSRARKQIVFLVSLVLLASIALVTGGSVTAQTVTATVPVGARPFGIDVNPATNRIYVSNWSDGTFSVINGANNSVIATPTTGINPWGVGVNPTTNRIYIADFNIGTVSVINGLDNSVIATPAVGTNPSGLGVNPTTNRIYVANSSDGTVSVINGENNSVIATPAVGTLPNGVGVNPTTNRVYVANNFSDTVSVINGADNSVIATVPVGNMPQGVGVNTATNRIFVANTGSNSVSVINGADNSVIATIPVGIEPWGVGVNPDTNWIYVSKGDTNTVSVINGADNSVIATVPVGIAPQGVGVNIATNRVYVANGSSNTVSVISDNQTLEVIKGVNFYEGTPGSPVEYAIVIENKGDYDATNVSVDDDIPDNTTLVSGSVTCSDAGASIDSEDPVKVTGITVGKGDVVVITFQVTINEDTALGTVIQNQGFVTCGTETIPSSNPGHPGEGSPTDVTVVEKILGSTAWIVPEGSTGGGFDTFILIQNPNDDPAPIKIALATEEGLQDFTEFEIPALSRTTLRLSELMPNEWSISTLVASEVPVVVERSMYWNKSEPSPYGNPGIYPYEMMSGHANLGLPAPMSMSLEMDSSIERSTDQYFPEGSTAGFDTWILLFNPNEEEAQARVTLMDATGPAVEEDVTIGPLSRKTVHLNKLLPNANEVATRVESSSFLVAERSMYWDPAASEKQPYEMIGGHATSGSPVTATNWYVAEGSTGGGFETYVLLQNPEDNEAPVNVTFMNEAGTANTSTLTMPAQSRSTLKVSDYVPGDFHVSTSVTSDVPIVAEHSMYWDKRETPDPSSMKDGHSCIGTTGTSGTWMVAEGSTGGGFYTFVLITNTENSEAQASVIFMTEEGAQAPVDITIPADSRYTLWVNEHLPDTFQVSTLVTSDNALVVERSMYWDNRELSPDGNFPARPFECKGGHSANGMDP